MRAYSKYRRAFSAITWLIAVALVGSLEKEAVLFEPSLGVGTAALFSGGPSFGWAILAGFLASGAFSGSDQAHSIVAALIDTSTCLLGFAMVSRVLGANFQLSSRRELILFSLLLGPLPATVSTLLTRLSGLPGHGSWTATWVAVALGLLLMTPLSLSLFQTGVPWNRRRWSVAFPTIIFIAIVFFGRVLVQSQFFRYQRSVLTGGATQAAQFVDTAFEDHLRTLNSIVAYYKASEDVRPEEFDLFVSLLVNIKDGDVAVMWLPAHGRVSRVYPPSLKNAMLDYDLAAQPDWHNILERCGENGHPAATKLFDGLPGVSTEQLIMIFVPVRRAQELDGYVVGVLSADWVLREALRQLSRPGDQLHFAEGPTASDSKERARSSFTFGDRAWTLELTEPFPSQARPRWGVPAGLAVFTVLQFFFILVNNRTVRIEQLNHEIEEGAESLRQVNEDLRLAMLKSSEADRAKSLFLANMSHEVRTPMNAILGLTHLVLESELKPAQTEYLRQVELSAESLLAMLNSVLDFTQLESGEMKLAPRPHPLNLLMEDSLRTVSLLAESKGLDIFLSFQPDLPETVLVDGNRLRQVFLNLLGNAVKFTERGEVEFSCVGAPLGENRYRFDFAVRDSGVGIRESQMQTIFEAFSQGDVSSSATHLGTGLGLAITSRLLDLMDSEVRVESTLGEGTTFSFALELEACEESIEPSFEGIQASEISVYLHTSNPRRELGLSRQLSEWGFPLCATRDEARIQIVDEEFGGGKHPPGLHTILLLRHSDLSRSLENCEEMKATPLVRPVSRSGLRDALLQVFQRPAEPEERLQETVPYAGFRALLADDSYTNRLLASAVLEKLGFRVDQVDNGARAATKPDLTLYDLFLMDLRMPVMDGYEAARIIRESFPNAVIIGATAQGLERVRAHDMDAILVKPYSQAELRECLARFLLPSAEFDPDRLLRATGGDLKSARAVAREFLDQLPSLLREIRGGNQELAVHTLCGEVEMFGMPTLTRLLLRLEERLAGETKSDDFQELVKAVVTQSERLDRSLRRFLSSMP